MSALPLGRVTLANRIAMAPMTRNRATGPGNSPTELMAEYYAQRAGAGLIITEGTAPSAGAHGYPNIPGLHSAEQIAGWRVVTDQVHAAGGVIFAQIMHAGRIGHPSLLPEGQIPVGPSAVAPAVDVLTADYTSEPAGVPRELSALEIAALVADFATAARNAIEAGFDGVEVHGANGYLIHQFLSSNANVRTDEWGGSVENRIRFATAVTTAVADAIGADRVGLRISPVNPFNDIAEQDSEELYLALAAAVAPLGLAYLHVGEVGSRDLTLRLRKEWPGTFVLNPFTYPEVTAPEALSLVEDGTADIISYGVMFLANPDLPARIEAGGPFNTPDRATFYGGGAAGYTDYPTLS